MTNELDMLDVSATDWILAAGTRPSEHEEARPLAANRPLRTVVLVCGRTPQAQSLDALLVATSGYDAIFVESIAHSYSCIKRVAPELVIISSDVDDAAACQLMSMLRVDRRSSGIPVLIRPIFREYHDANYDLAELDQDTSTQFLATPMN
jgi:hypothetical protein